MADFTDKGSWKNITNRHKFRTGWLIDSDGNPINEADLMRSNTDAFGKTVVKNYKNVGDFGANYQQTPEKYRLYLNGSEVRLQYGANAKFEDVADAYILKPAGGDTMLFRTAERFRYVSNYVIELSSAYETSQDLNDGDKIVHGYGDPDIDNDMAGANGWFWEWRGTAEGTKLYLTTYRDGGDPLDEQLIKNPYKLITEWQRHEDDINWYNVGNRIARQTYTDDGTQFNRLIGTTSVDDGRGPSEANFPYVFAIKAAAGTTGLELTCGSIAVNILGDTTPKYRVKESRSLDSILGDGQWQPLFAIRRKPSMSNVYVNLSAVDIIETSADADVDVLAISVGEDETDIVEGDWGTPDLQNAYNTALQYTNAITQFPDNTGTLQTTSATFGGYQLGWISYRTAGTGTNRRQSKGNGVRKRAIPNGDVVVFLGRSDSNMDVEVDFETEQEF